MAIVSRYGVTGEESAVEAYREMLEDGLPPGGINSDWRDPKLQVALFLDNYTKTYLTSAKTDRRVWNGVPYWRRKVRLSNGAPTVSVAVPGSSKHEIGLAIDFDVAQREWVKANGRRRGWYWPTWAQQPATREDWHMEFDTTYTPTPKPQEEDTMAYPYKVDGVHLFLIAPEFVKHFTDAATAEFVKNVTTANDEWVQVSADQFPSQLDSFGIPRNVVVLGKGVLNPETGEIQAGAVWSRAREAAAKTITVPAPVIDLAAIARAVNDDAAKRMQS